MTILTWTDRANHNDVKWLAECYAADLELVVSVGVSNISDLGVITSYSMASNDGGASWSIGSGEDNYIFADVCYSPELNIFVVVGGYGTHFGLGGGSTACSSATSTDGLSWTPQTIGPDVAFSGYGLTHVVWSPELSLFVAIGTTESSYGTYYSSDGVNWYPGTGFADNWNCLCWSPDLSLFVALAGSNGVRTSTDGMNWSYSTGGAGHTGQLWIDLCWSPELSLFVAISTTVGYTHHIQTSSDGFTWYGGSSSVPNYSWTTVNWSADVGVFIVLGYRTVHTMVSSDGINWSLDSDVPSALGTGILAEAEYKCVLWNPYYSNFVAIGVYYSVAPDYFIYGKVVTGTGAVAPETNVLLMVMEMN